MSDIKRYIKNNIFQLSKKIDKLKDEEILYEIQNNLLKVKDENISSNKIPNEEKIFNIKNTNDILAKKPQFLIKDILPIQKNEINIISSKGGVGKSILAIYLLTKIKEQENLNVFGYFSEDDLGIIKNRIELINQNIDIDILGRETRPKPFLNYNENSNFVSSDFFDQFKIAMKNYDVIVIDPLLAFLLTNENSNIEARAFMNLFNEWVAEEEKTFIFLHHHNKEDGIRGATDFVNAARIHYKIERKKDNTILCKLEKENNLPDFKSKVIDLFGVKKEISHNGKFNQEQQTQGKNKIIINNEEFDALAKPEDFDDKREYKEFFAQKKGDKDEF